MDNVAVMMRLLVWGAVLTALVAGWAPAQTAAAVAVDGTVKDRAGLAVAGAIVTLETAAGAEQRTTTTDQAGAFHFGHVAGGGYKGTGAGGSGAAGGAGDVDDRSDAAAEGAGGGATEVGGEAAGAGHLSALSGDVRGEPGAADGGAEVSPRVQDPGGSGDAAGHGDRRGNPTGAEQIPGVRAGGGRLREAVRGAIYQPRQRHDDSPCDPAGGISPGPAVFLQGHGELQVASVVLDLDGVRVQGR